MNVATIDIGTNTTLLLLARASGPGSVEVIDERAEITRLGRGIGGDGALGADGIAKTLDALRAFAALARVHGAAISAVGTEALRRAPNASEFLEAAALILGRDVEVIDGGREAELTFRAVLAAFPDLRREAVIVVDIGGGSTEIVVARAGRPTFQTSLPLGSVRLTERHVRHDPARPDEVEAIARTVDAALAEVPFPGEPSTLVGVAGTVTSVAAMVQSLVSYDPARVHGYVLTRQALGQQIDRLRQATQADRERMAGLDPRRADVILAGAVILERIAAAARTAEVRVSDRGIRWGLLDEILAGTAPA
jgi:exopolyphosphatase / guanosine-5'-triphosphate,3'-diphosphate pyrophosphatase